MLGANPGDKETVYRQWCGVILPRFTGHQFVKSEFLKAFDADIFFDDQKAHCDAAKDHVTTAHVPQGLVKKEHL